jgi:hypothetical protein
MLVGIIQWWPTPTGVGRVLVTTQVQALDPIRTSNLLDLGMDENAPTYPCQPNWMKTNEAQPCRMMSWHGCPMPTHHMLHESMTPHMAFSSSSMKGTKHRLRTSSLMATRDLQVAKRLLGLHTRKHHFGNYKSRGAITYRLYIVDRLTRLPYDFSYNHDLSLHGCTTLTIPFSKGGLIVCMRN